MKLHFFFICIALFLATPESASQTSIISSDRDLITFMNSDLDYIENQRDRYAKIEGSAYLDEAFHNGSVSYQGMKYTGLQLRHNTYEGYFEFKTDQGIKFFDPRITPIDTVWIEEDTFIYGSYQSGNAEKKNFMKLMNRGATRVFQLSQMILIQPEPAKGYEEARPARFEKRGDLIFIQTGEEIALEFKGKKSVEDIFPEHYVQLNEYAKSEKLKLKETGEIISLCAYFDSIR
jgi:hypothetical protein